MREEYPMPGRFRSPYEVIAEYSREIQRLTQVLRRAKATLARGRTAGNDWQAAALEAENIIIDALGIPGASRDAG